MENQEAEAYNLKALPVGFRFVPTDEQCFYYLVKKVRNQPYCRGLIFDVDIYQYHPKILTEKFKGKDHDGKWYFFTPTKRKYKNGTRPDCSAVDGFWRPTAGKRSIEKFKAGTVRCSVFFATKDRKKDKAGKNTGWLMREYRLEEATNPLGTQVLEDYVLSKIYYRPQSDALAHDANNLQLQKQVQPALNQTQPSEEICDSNNQISYQPLSQQQPIEPLNSNQNSGPIIKSNFDQIHCPRYESQFTTPINFGQGSIFVGCTMSGFEATLDTCNKIQMLSAHNTGNNYFQTWPYPDYDDYNNHDS